MASERVFNAAVRLCGMQRTPQVIPIVLVSEPYAVSAGPQVTAPDDLRATHHPTGFR
jgi:hypothetical protein